MPKSWRSSKAIPVVAVLGSFGLFQYSQGLLNPTYEPSSPEIEQLAIATTMTPKAQQLFYKQNPRIESKEQFHALCRKARKNPEKTILLGCFTSNGYRGNIIIQAVSDPRLKGTMEVAAAHELLHAAYQELNPLERSRLAPRLKQAAKKVKAPHLLPVLQEYEAGDPDIYYNELHSHLGTELADLGDPELEKHYQRYFSDRQQIIALAQGSRSTLSELENKADQLTPEIDTLEANLKDQEIFIQAAVNDIESSARNLNQRQSDLIDLRQRAEARLRQGDSSLVNQFELEKAQFNEVVNQHNRRIQEHKTRVQQFNQQITTYKQKVAEYNKLAQTKRSILSPLQFNTADSTIPQATP